MKLYLLIIPLLLAVVFISSYSPASALSGKIDVRETDLSHSQDGLIEVWRTKVFERGENGNFLGTGNVACIFTSAQLGVRECFGTYILPLGRIKILGTVNNRFAFTLAIVGGTGVYQGVTGTMTALDYSQGRLPRRATLYFRLK